MVAVVVPGVAVTAEITGGVVADVVVKLAGWLAATGDVALLPKVSAEVTL
jgi:hypothetical protein